MEDSCSVVGHELQSWELLALAHCPLLAGVAVHPPWAQGPVERLWGVAVLLPAPVVLRVEALRHVGAGGGQTFCRHACHPTFHPATLLVVKSGCEDFQVSASCELGQCS